MSPAVKQFAPQTIANRVPVKYPQLATKIIHGKFEIIGCILKILSFANVLLLLGKTNIKLFQPAL
jgi:hypothetical protein